MTKRIRIFTKTVFWIIITGSVAFSVSYTTLAFTPLGNMMGNKLSHSLGSIDEVKPADYIVILGGDVTRIVDAARLHNEGVAPEIILSGGYENHITALRLCNIPEKDTLNDTAATSTADHPRTIAALPDVEKSDEFVIVTSGCHFWRTRQVFEAAGYNHVQFFQYQSKDAVSKIGAGAKGAIDIMYELAAIMKYKLAGKLDE